MKLSTLVILGTAGAIVTGAALFLWFAWLLTDQPNFWDMHWIDDADGQDFFDAARTTATILAVAGLGGAALVAYRRQDTAERAHRVSIDAQHTASEQLALDSNKYELDLKRHQLDADRRKDEEVRDLRARFTSATEQLSNPARTIRMAGAYALAALADDWGATDNTQRQVCVNVLCSYLRSPTVSFDGDPLVRRTIQTILEEHLYSPHKKIPARWRDCLIDLSGAELVDADFASCQFEDTAKFERTQFRGKNTSFRGAIFGEHSKAIFTGATFEVEEVVEFFGAEFGGWATQFERTTFQAGKRIDFSRATFNGLLADFTRSTFEAPRTLFDTAALRAGRITFRETVFKSPETSFSFASIGAYENTLPPDIDPRSGFFRTEFAPGSVVNFNGASFRRINFKQATFNSNRVDFSSPREWEQVVFDWSDQPENKPNNIYPAKWPPEAVATANRQEATAKKAAAARARKTAKETSSE